MSSPKVVNEPCSKCRNGEMTHPELYIFECNICGYKYKMHPAAKSKTVEILNKSNWEENKRA